MDTWVCPSDRHLALRAKLGTGWSGFTKKSSIPLKVQEPLTEDETAKIVAVIRRAEKLDQMEVQRVSTLVDRLEKLKIHSLGDGRQKCSLCGDHFKILGASPNLCLDCSKNVCGKCGIDTFNSKKTPIYLCKICNEKREVWRKSGAWFYKGLPGHLKAALNKRNSRDDNNNSFKSKNFNNTNFNKRYNLSQSSYSSENEKVYGRDSISHENRAVCKRRERRSSNLTKPTSYTPKNSNKNDFYYDHYKYRPSFLINNISRNDDDKSASINNSDNELDMVNRLQTNRRVLLNMKSNDSNDEGNNYNDKNKIPSSSPPKNYHFWNNESRENISESTKNNSENIENDKAFIRPKVTQYIRPSRKFSSDEEEVVNENSLNVVCKKVPPKESENDNSSYDMHFSTNVSINRSSDLSTNRSTTHSSEQSVSSVSINQNINAVDSNPLSVFELQKYKSKTADLLPLHIPDNFVIEEDGCSVPETPASLGVLEFSLVYLSKDNTLRCVVHRAKNLPAMDRRGMCDSFVRTHLLPGNVKATRRQTKTVEGNRNPEWREVIEYHGVFAEDLKKKDMRLSVFDEDTLTDKFIGETIINLRSLHPDVCKEYSVYLSGFQVIGDMADKDTTEAGRLFLGLYYEDQSAKLTITVHRCVNLLSMDSNGFSDPYVKMYLKPPRDRKTKRKTSVKSKTLNPEFHEDFTYKLKQDEIYTKVLEISVWDKDIGANDFIGKVTLSKDSSGSGGRHWNDAINMPDQLHNQWHVLKHTTS